MVKKTKKVKQATKYDALQTVYGAKSDADTLAWLQASGLNRLKSYPNFKDKAGHSLLTLAASQGKLETLKYLLKEGAKIDYKQPNNFDALTSALQFRHYDVAKHLIDSGVSLQGAKNTKIKLLRGEEPGSETDAQTVLKNSIEAFESMNKPKIVNQVRRPVELNILALLAPHSDSDDHVSATDSDDHVSDSAPDSPLFTPPSSPDMRRNPFNPWTFLFPEL